MYFLTSVLDEFVSHPTTSSYHCERSSSMDGAVSFMMVDPGTSKSIPVLASYHYPSVGHSKCFSPTNRVHWWDRSPAEVIHENDRNQFMHVAASGIQTTNDDAPANWIDWLGYDGCFSPTTKNNFQMIRSPGKASNASGHISTASFCQIDSNMPSTPHPYQITANDSRDLGFSPVYAL